MPHKKAEAAREKRQKERGESSPADQYIEKFAHENGRKYKVMVATSDRLEQIIIRGQGCGLYSARDLQEEVKRVKNQIREHTDRPGSGHKNYLLDGVSEELLKQMKRYVPCMIILRFSWEE